MNKHCYRHIFSRTHGELRVVSELARSCGTAPGQRRGTGARLWVTVRRTEWLLGLALFAGPAMAGGIITDNQAAQQLRPEVIATQNGLPQVNINAPNQAGISHNQYQQFDVGPQGAILNNSAVMTSTQLAGIIQGNPNLNPNAAPAQVILNEVNSNNPSHLRGYLEVAGGMAQVIVANPAGIICNGCGTINAGRMTLTTGRPQLNADGSLAGYQVERGLVSIEGGGLNGDDRHDTRYVEILARAVEVNAGVWAKDEISVVAGRNHISADGKTVTPLASDGKPPDLAIDMGQLGGMYSGHIRMIGTEAGVGVRSQGVHLQAGATLTVSSEGRLSWQSGAVEGFTQAGGDITLAAREGIEHHGKLHSGGQLIAQSREGDIRQSGTLAAAGDVRLDAARGIQSSGHLLAGSDGHSTLIREADLTLRSDEDIRASGSLLSKKNVNVTGRRVDIGRGRLAASHAVIVARAGGVGLQQATVDSSQLTVSTPGNIDAQQAQVRADRWDIHADGLSTQGGVWSQVGPGESRFALAGSLDNTDGDIATRQLSLDTACVNNLRGRLTSLDGIAQHWRVRDQLSNREGMVGSNGSLVLEVGSLDNQAGTLQSQSALSVTARQAVHNHQGKLLAGQQLALNTLETVDNRSGTMRGEHLQLTTQGLNNAQGQLLSQGLLRLNARQSVDNQHGLIDAGNLLDIRTDGGWDNRNGKTQGGSQVSAVAGHINNAAGMLRSGGGMTLDTAGNLINQAGTLSAKQGLSWQGGTDSLLDNDAGTLFSGAQMSLQGGHLNNRRQGIIQSEQAVALNLDGGWDNQDGKLFSAGSLALNARRSVDNQHGLIDAGNLLDIRTGGGWDNRDGSAQGGGHVRAVAEHLNNAAGRLRSGGGITLDTAGNLINQSGTLSAKQELSWQGGAGSLLDNDAGTLLSGGEMSLRGWHLNNRQQGAIQSQQAVTLDLDGNCNNRGGKLVSEESLHLNARRSVDNQHGLIEAANALESHTDGGWDNQGGKLVSKGRLHLSARRSVDNRHGLIEAADALEIRTDGDWYNRDGSAQGGSRVSVAADNINNAAGGLRSGGGMILNTAGNLANQAGTLSAKQEWSWQGGTDSLLDNDGGTLFSGAEMSLQGGSLNNRQQGMIQSEQAVTLNLDGAWDNQGGKLLSKKSLHLNARRSVDNQQGRIEAADALNIRTDGGWDNRDGSAQGGSRVSVAADNINNAAGGLRSGGGMILNTAGNLANQAGTLSATQGLNWLGGTDSLLDNDAGTVYSGEALSLQGGSLNNRQQGMIQSEQALTLDMQGAWDNQGGRLVSEGSLHLNARRSVDNRHGLIEAADALHIRTDGGWDNRDGSAQGGSQVSVAADNINNAAGGLRSGGGMTLDTVGSLINQAGTLSAKREVSWRGGADSLLENDGGTLLCGAQMSLQGGSLNNRQQGIIQGEQAVTLNLDGAWDNQGGKLASEGSLHLNARRSVDNRHGIIDAGKLLDIRTDGGWDNRDGSAQGGSRVSAVAGHIDNTAGGLQSGGGMAVNTAGNLINQSGTLSAKQGLSWQGGPDSLLDNDAGMLRSDEQMSLQGGSLNNRQQGAIKSQQALILNLDGDWNNQGGELASEGSNTVRAINLHNTQGDIKALDALDVQIVRTLNNSNGRIFSQGSQSLGAEDFVNERGWVGSQGRWSAVASRFDNREGSVLSQQDSTLAVTTFDNCQGSLRSAGSLVLRIAQDIYNRAGKISAQLHLDMRGVTDGAATGKLHNAGGQLLAGDALAVAAQSVDNRQDGLLYSQKQMSLTLNDSLDNRQGKLKSGEGLQLSAQSLFNTEGVLDSQQQLGLHILGVLHNAQGTLRSNGSQQISADRIDNQKGLVSSMDALTLDARTLDNSDGTSISKRDGLYRVDLLNNPQGKIYSGDALTLNGGQVNNQAGLLVSTRAMTLGSARLNNSGQGKITSRDALHVQADRLINRDGGLLLGTTHTNVTAHELDNTSGRVQSAGTLTLSQMTQLDNRQGYLVANDALNINTTDPKALALFNQGGAIKSGDVATVNARTLDNQGGTILSHQALTSSVQQDYTHQTGDTLNSNGVVTFSVGGVLTNLANWLLSGGLIVNSTHFTNQGTLVGKTLDLTTGTLNNQGRLEAGNMTLVSDTLNNPATIVGDNVSVRSRIIDNDGHDAVMAAAESLCLKAGERLTNRGGGLIYSADTLQLGSDDLIENRASRIEANGDVAVEARRLDNLREGLDIVREAEKNDYAWNRANYYWRSYDSKVNPNKGTIAPTTQRLTFRDDAAAANGRYGTLLEIDAAGKKAQLHVRDNKGKMRKMWVNYLALTPGSDGGYDMTFYETRGFRQKTVPTPYHNTFWRECDRGRTDTWHPERYIDVAEAPFVTDYSNFRERMVTGTVTTDRLVSAGTGADFLAGGDMVLRICGQLLNDASTLSANRNLTIEGDGKVINRGYSVNERRQERIVDHYDKDARHWYPTFNSDETTALATIDGILTGHGKVTISGIGIENITVNPAQISTVKAAQKAAAAARAEWQRNPLAVKVEGANWGMADIQLTPGSRPLTSAELSLTPADRRLSPAKLTHSPTEWSFTPAELILTPADRRLSPAELIHMSAERGLSPAELMLTPGSRPLTPAELTLTDQQHVGRVATSIPNNGLFRQQPVAGSRYLVVTDRRFTDRGRFISSDYLLQRVGYDPAQVHKRLSDGYYEQRLVREQLLRLTGRQSARGEDAMAQYQALMNSGTKAASDFQLVPGIALTPAQIAALQQDIVWLVSETVDTAEGPQTVWVPKVYLASNTLRLTGDGALIGGGSVNLSTRSLASAGSLFADKALEIDASHFLQQGGDIRADTINIRADSLALSTQLQDALRQATMSARDISLTGGDILLQGARLDAKQNLSLNARNNLDITTARSSTTADLVMSTGTIANRTGNAITIAGNHMAQDNDRMARVSGEWQQGLGSTLSAGGNLSLKAGQDISLQGSQAEAGGVTHAQAGGGVKLLADTTTNTTHLRAGDRTSSVSNRREEDNLHLSTLSGAKGLTLQVGATLVAEGAQVDSSAGSIGLSAQQVTVSEARQRVRDRDSERKRNGKTQSRREMETATDSAVSSILTGRDGIMVVAREGDISITGSTLHSEQGALALRANRDIILNSATESEYQFSDELSEKKGYMSKSSRRSVQEDRVTRETGTLLSGNTVSINAGNDLTVTGSAVVGDHDVTLRAGNNIDITAATETQSHYLLEENKKSGLMGGGGIGFTVGSQSTRHQVNEDGTTQSQSVSTVGSSQGNLSITAGNRLHIGGADLVAGQDLALTGDSVQIDPGYDQQTSEETFESKQSGLTLALSGTVGSALNTAVGSAQQAKKESSGRLQALQVTKAALSGIQAAQAYDYDNALTEAADYKNANQGATNTVGVTLSYGSQSSRSETRSKSVRSQGSMLNAGKDLKITATGTGADGKGDIVVQGSQLKAGVDISLAAMRDITLLSAQNTEQIDSKNSSKGGSAGIGIGVGSGGYGITVSASVNAGKGHAKGRSLTHTLTALDAGQTLTLNSGRDTALTGAQVNADKISADVGRNLTLASEQDSDQYDSQQQNVSAGGSFTYGSMTGSANVNVSRNALRSNYDSVTEQTGLFAGKGGYDIKVKGHTQLDGAVIASTAAPDKNMLDTGTLGWTDIDNQADYKSEQQSAGFNSGGPIGSNMLSNVGALPLAGMNREGHASGTTKAAVAAGGLIVRDMAKQQQDISQLSRDTDHANDGSLSRIFNKQKEQERQKEAQLISDIGTQALDIYNTHAATTATREASARMSDMTTRAKLEEQAKKELETAKSAHPAVDSGSRAVKDNAWHSAYDHALASQGAEMGGSVRMGANAVVGALQGLAGGDIKAALAQGAAPYLAGQVKAITTQGKPYGELSDAEKRNNVVAHAILGGVIAELSGASAAAGATGAAAGELAAPAIALALYGTADGDKLTSQQKQHLGALSTLASGIAAGVSSDSASGAVVGAQAGKNAVENNLFSPEVMPQGLTDLGQSASSYAKYAQDNNLPPEQVQADLTRMVEGDLPEGADIVKAVLSNTPVSDTVMAVLTAQEAKDYALALLSTIPAERALAAVGKAANVFTNKQLIRAAEKISTANPGKQFTQPRDLNEQILWRKANESPSNGFKLEGMNNDPRFPASAGFEKKSVNHKLPDGSNIEIHYQYNSTTDKTYDMKIVTPKRSDLQPKPSIKAKP